MSGVESVEIHYNGPKDLSRILEYDPTANRFINVLNTEELPIGKYTFSKIKLVDKQKNEFIYQYTANDMGEYDFEIVPPDVTPPTLVSIDVSPKEVEIGDVVHIIADITDDQSGVKSATLYYIGPDNSSGKKINLTQNETGKYEGSIVFEDLDPVGTWRITYLDLLDNKDNQKLYYNSDYYNKPAEIGEGYEFIDLSACNIELLPPDIKAPVTKLELISDVPPNEGWYRSSVTAILSVTDEDSESFETYYRMNEGEWYLYEGPITITDNGIYKFEYFSIDLEGNREETHSNDIKIDKTSPITNYIINPQTPVVGDWYSSNVTLEFNATDEASGVSTTLYRINEAEWTGYSVPLEFIKDGIYHIDYKSVDNAGNEHEVKSIEIKIDKAPPVTSINLDSSKPRKGDWYSSNVTVSFDQIDEGSGASETYYRINEGEWIRFLEPFELVNEGTYQIDYKSIDVLGNEEAFKSEVIKIDKTSPVTVINLNSQTPENEGGYRSDVTVGFEAKDEFSGVWQTSYRINGGVWTPFIKPFILSGEGAYTIEYQSVDHAGNEEGLKSKIIKIDKIGPSTTINLPSKDGDWYRTEVTATFTVTGEDAGGYYTKYQINGDQWLTYKDSVTFKDDGIFNVNYYSVDTVGNKEDNKNQVINIDKTSPVTTFNINSQLPKVGEQFVSTVMISFYAEDATSKILKTEYRINNGQWFNYSGPIDFTDDGTYYLDYKSTDHAGNVEAIKTLILKVKILKPGSWAKVIDGGADVEVGLEEGAKFTFKQVGNGEIFVEKKTPEQVKPSGFRLIRGSSYDITTTSTFTGDVMVTLPFDASDVKGRVEDLKLMHWKVDHWENITAFVDKDNNTITGKTTSFSPFVVVETYETSNRELSGIIDKQPDGGVDPNANQTGSGVNQQNNANEVIKSINMVLNDGTSGHQKTHGEYQNNTNSCSSCHQTHTAASKSLLFKDGVYNTCSSCHDGTLGFYNVFETHSDLSSAGTFGGSEAGNMSVHLASGTVQIKAAPGGNLNGDGTWTSEFNCASCHSPHGSYSDRLLHYNPNTMGQKTSTDGGIGLSGEQIYEYSSMPDANDNGIGEEPTEGKEILVRGTAAQFGLDVKDGLRAGDIVIRVLDLRLGHDGKENRWVVSESPWLYGHDYALPFNNYWTRFYAEPMATETQLLSTTAPDGTEHYKYIVDNSDLVWNSNLYIESAKGYIYASNGDTILNNLTRGDVARAYVVKLDLIPKWDPDVNDANGNGTYDAGEEQKFGDIVITTVNQRALFAGELNPLSVNVQDRWGVDVKTNNGGNGVNGWGVAMSSYCSACHTDYLAQSGNETGTWSKAHRHTTISDEFTCVRCHFAHGTDVTVMRDAKNLTVEKAATQLFAGDTSKAKAYMMDQNPSSALKRYTNMSVCWACHTEKESEQFINNEYYFNNVQAPKGLDESEGKANWPRQ